MQLSLRARLTLKQTACFSLLLVILAVVIYAAAVHRVAVGMDDQVRDRHAIVRNMMRVRGRSVIWLNAAADPEVDDLFDKSNRYYQVIDSAGSVVASSRASAIARVPITSAVQTVIATHRPVIETVRALDGAELRVLNTFVAGSSAAEGYVLRVGMSTDALRDYRKQYAWFLLLAIPLVIGIQALTAWRLTAAPLRPLERLGTLAENIRPFEPGRRFPSGGAGDELCRCTTALNRMVERFELSCQETQRVLRNLRHEMRAPLTVLRAECEMALRCAKSEPEYREALSRQLEQIDMAITTMVEMGTSVQAEHPPCNSARKPEDISELVTTAVDGMSMVAGRRGLVVSRAVCAGIVAHVNAAQVYRVVLNLVDNAIKYTPANGRVHVTLTRESGAAVITVNDSGAGIPAEAIPKIFDPSYRSPSARRSTVPGSGLGLAFARQIVNAHGGEINVISTEGEGSCFRVALPLSPAEDMDATDMSNSSTSAD